MAIQPEVAIQQQDVFKPHFQYKRLCHIEGCTTLSLVFYECKSNACKDLGCGKTMCEDHVGIENKVKNHIVSRVCTDCETTVRIYKEKEDVICCLSFCCYMIIFIGFFIWLFSTV